VIVGYLAPGILSVWLVWLVWLVWFVWLVWIVWLVWLGLLATRPVLSRVLADRPALDPNIDGAFRRFREEF
jgi:hypothetical protein